MNKKKPHQYNWKKEIKQWINKKKNIHNDLSKSYVQFFEQAFENTACPEKAWFGIHKYAISLVVGGVFLAAVVYSGKDKGIWLLLQTTPEIEGWHSKITRFSQDSDTPLKWFHSEHFNKVSDIVNNTDIWKSYLSASTKIFELPVFSSDRDAWQEKREKVCLSSIFSPNPIQEIKKYQFTYQDLSKTQQEIIVNSRIGQGKFRTQLLKYWQNSCAVTGCQKPELLKASHIKPWRYSNNDERLDKYNGFLFIPNLDTAFDIGLISFEDNGSIKISAYLDEDDKLKLGIHSEMKIEKLEEQHIKYLKYHREHIFQKRENLNQNI